MNNEELGTVCGYISANWPSAPMSRSTVDIYKLEVGDFDYPVVLGVLRDYSSDFPPVPNKLRRQVIERMLPRYPDADEAYNELMAGIARVGWASPEPDWSHPAIGEFVASRGGWAEVCATTPTRSVFDAQSASAAGTFKAQLRDDWRAVVARHQSAAVRTQLGRGANAELEAE